ncbi:pyridine nucleotide-disulfide oxidoreductase [Saccharopolyspora subtropica]|uniref:FAD-dependent oxidoreductase n=1 Tax=Saccharopolyspora thermophila TaxID=89367 RepID=A0A917K7K3_9PSEU|nr:FAD-dependent oxidoreductase [Saccharopolyspora subtropica]GGJ01713.1 pyridine nucleotide-disulfide oxidoreductase [Saccharopolyspora subtropica]
MRTIAVVGTSLAGYSAAQQLRAQGFEGRLVMVGDEVHLPYDRPPLSKDFLLGKIDQDALALADQSDIDELAAEWRTGDPAVRLRCSDASIELLSGERIGADGVVIATGAAPRTLPGTEGIAGVHALRTLEDAARLRDELAGDRRVVVVGAGFIGAEVASSCAALGLDVTLVEAAELPLVHALGLRMAAACVELHGDHGVRVRLGTGVEQIRSGSDRVTGVRLTSGEELPADVVVVGIGVSPNTGWLADSGLTLADGVGCDAGGVTELPNVVAVGDVARVHRPDLGRSVRTEHWTAASSQPRAAIRNLLAGRTVEHHDDVPYFWSDQYGVRIQFAGTVQPGDEVTVVDGDVADRCFLAHYERGGRLVGVLAFNQPRAFGRARRQIAKPALDAPLS